MKTLRAHSTLVLLLLTAGSGARAQENTNVWIRAATNAAAASATLATNWSLNHAPTNGEVVYLGTNSTLNMTWDVTGTVLTRWVQAAGYTGTVTVATKYPGYGDPTSLQITGDCVINGGIWTHVANTGNTVQSDWLKLAVGGDFTVNTNAMIDLLGKGYAPTRGPGAGNSTGRGGGSPSTRPGQAASHGGRGGATTTLTNYALTYGPVMSPTNLGSGAEQRGGGAICAEVQGKTRIYGVVRTDGAVQSAQETTAGSGGSVYIVTGEMEGNGYLDARGGSSCWSSGGGRVAVILTNSDSFGSVNMRAYGGSDVWDGSAGTVYRERKSDGHGRGILYVDNGNLAVTMYTPLPWEVNPPSSPETTSEVANASLTIINQARVALSTHLRMRDLATMTASTVLNLQENTLFLGTNEHSTGTGLILSNTLGQIVWNSSNVTYYLSVQQGPNGTATTNQTGLYTNGETVAISAAPNTGYKFIQWEGNVPEIDATNTNITVTMNQSRLARGLFASTNATTRTWLGWTNAYATNPANWYPGIVPTNGDAVVLDATSPRFLTWGLNVNLASWKQELGYTGTVTVQTRYPGYGDFTNLAITGDCDIQDGTWTHTANSGDTAQVDRLSMTVGGNFTLGASADINVNAKGYAAQRGPGAGNAAGRGGASFSTVAGRGASYGGRGSYTSTLTTNSWTYGSAIWPNDLGSGASAQGGGAVLIAVEGTATVSSTISANGTCTTTESTGGSGGSIRLVAGTFLGSGPLRANGQGACWAGAGGRIALISRSAEDLGLFTCQAFGGADNNDGGEGSIYYEKPSQADGRGILLANNNNYVTATNVYMELPPAGGSNPWELSWTILTLTNRAYVGLISNVKIGDLFIRTNTPTRLFLNGYTLTLATPFHPDWGDTNWVVYNGGQIIWGVRGTVMIYR